MKEVKCTCTNGLQAENCDKKCGHNEPDEESKNYHRNVGYTKSYSIKAQNMNTREPKGMPRAEVTVTKDFRNYLAGDRLNIRFSGRDFIIEKLNDNPISLGVTLSMTEVNECTTGILKTKLAEPQKDTTKWVITMDAIPQDGQDVLFVTISEHPRKLCGKFYSVDSWCRLNMFCSMDGGFHSADRIAVWMPYPELPPHNL